MDAMPTATEILAANNDAVTAATRCLDRIAAREEAVRAWAYLDPAAALKTAVALDAGPRGALHGVPIGVKDVILTRDMPTRYNSPIHDEPATSADAGCVAVLRAAGALMLGKTETVEFAATGTKAPTRNPHALDHTPGGSSSGSAAAVADGHVPIALATQTGGSIIRPASYCGIWGIKPTWGLVSNEGAKSFAPSLDTIGWYARSADDLSLILDRFDPEPARSATLAGARIGIARTPYWAEAGPATRDAIARTEQALRNAGAVIEEVALPDDEWSDIARVHDLVMHAEGGAAFLAADVTGGDGLHANMRAMVSARTASNRQRLVEAYDKAAAWRRAFDALAGGYDAILTPSTVAEAPRGLAATGDYLFNGMWTLLHVPCVNVPGCIAANGLPVGVTITGPRFADRRVLAMAAAIGALLSG
ncbi:amidase [Sphingomonas sp. CGMCC 1.13654]|uniref:Amidase n=1 Tax=Sphingomonas chungangi TaxID=2683589 RepID=A0A838LBF1_9SPHN|nr:amidase [Sphingomonas chungangi]MBA2934818.1 amidase [Sphingomonas chungangi]MVW58129.1 amidase [Sphingomonas chungangi]